MAQLFTVRVAGDLRGIGHNTPDDIAFASGLITEDDGQGGFFTWDTASSADDSVDRFNPPSGGTAAGWKRAQAPSTALHVAPMDWTTFIGIVNANAYTRPVQMGAGAWTCNAAVALASGAHIIGGSGVTVTSSLGVVSSVTNAVFLASPTVGANTTVAGTNTPGTSTISVTSTLSGAIAAGAMISIRKGLRNLTYTVVSVSGLGPYTVTVERPILMQFDAADGVYVITAMPQDIRIDGRGMTITGPADRYVEFTSSRRCQISDIRMLYSGAVSTDILASYDVGGYQNEFRNLELRCDSKHGVGIALESNERSKVLDCIVSDCTSYGIALYDCVDSDVQRSQSRNNQNGIVLVTDGAAKGCLYCRVDNCEATGNSQYGFLISNVSDYCLLSNCHALYNTTYGIYLVSGRGHQVLNCAAEGNGVAYTSGAGLVSGASVTDALWSACKSDDSGLYAMLIQGPCEVVGLSVNAGNKGVYCSDANAAYRVHITNALINTTYGPNLRTGKNSFVTLAHAACSVGIGTETNIQVQATGGVGNTTILNDVVCTGAGTGKGLDIQAACTVRHKGLDVSAAGTPIANAGYVNVGTVQLNGATPVDVTWPDLKATDHVSLRLQTVAGTQGKEPVLTKTAGTKFSVVGIALDTSTYEYRVE